MDLLVGSRLPGIKSGAAVMSGVEGMKNKACENDHRPPLKTFSIQLNPQRYPRPVPRLDVELDIFSISGLKTVLEVRPKLKRIID